ncbi:HNH endonuclease [Cytobacillus firmus]|uniref:HNH endonuclease n=1 Tax=Cytobacillus firmus TaxID=1399 RepID=UPI0021C74F82|nr:HNH endonuclease [Cytobacillus firmus]MCU1808245.1 HNH endonuclease [Cytobacillus firmus]
MGMIRKLGKYTGKAAGFVIGGPIQIVGELTGSGLIKDIGKGVQKASEFAGDTVGQVASGAVDTVAGIVNEDSGQRDKGLGNMGNAVTRTAKGVVVTAKNTFVNGGEVIGGVIDGDNDRVKRGATSIVKTVAIGALAVGLVDVIDGADGGTEVAHAEGNIPDAANLHTDSAELTEISTVNADLAGSTHPITGVPFDEEIVDLPNGTSLIGTFPEFDAEYEAYIDESLYLQSDYVHFSYANQELYDDIQMNPDLAEDLGLTQQEIINLANGDTPEGFTWHHNQHPGVLELVDEETHAATGHTGGRELWGGGNEYR